MNPWQKHWTLAELAKQWHVSRSTVESWFNDEPGVIRYGHDKLRKGRQRTHRSVRIPDSVAQRVYNRHVGKNASSRRPREDIG